MAPLNTCAGVIFLTRVVSSLTDKAARSLTLLSFYDYCGWTCDFVEMLTKRDLRGNKLLFRAYSALNILPLKFDKSSGLASVETSCWKLALWKLNMMLLTLFVAFVTFRLIQVVLYPTEYFDPLHFSLHNLVTCFFTMSVYFAHWLFNSSPGSTVQIYNEFTKNLNEGNKIDMNILAKIIF